MTTIDLIKQRSNLVEFLRAQGLDLAEQAGGARYRAMCPFHEDRRTPSFMVFVSDNRWHCFGGCPEDRNHGDEIDYIQIRDKVDKSEAIRIVAEFYGIDAAKPEKPSVKTSRKTARRRVQEYLHAAIWERPELLEWLHARSVTDDDIGLWGIGAGTGRLREDLGGEIDERVLLDIGVLRKSKTLHEYIPQGFITVPVFNGTNSISHWWLRDPGNKSRHQWYNKHKDGGLFLNARDLTDHDEVYLVEGFFEVCQLKKHGVAVVGLMGKGSAEQIGVLNGQHVSGGAFEELEKKKTYNVWMDRDSRDNTAGQDAAVRIANGLCSLHNVYICKCPHLDQDPDEYLRAGGTVEAIEKVPHETRGHNVERTSDGYMLRRNSDDEVDRVDRITNFIMDIKYHFVGHGDDITRMVQLSRNGTRTRQLAILGEDLYSRMVFGKWLRRKTKDCVIKGSTEDFEDLMEYLVETDRSMAIKFSSMYGNIKDNIWLFDNGAIKDGEVYRADKDGITWIEVDGVQGVRTPTHTEMEATDHRKQLIPDTWDDMEDILRNIARFYPDDMAKTLIGFAAATIYRDPIVYKYACFPHLFLRGVTDSGKTKYCRLAQSLLGASRAPTDTLESTSKALLRHFGSYSNMPIHLSEYIPKFEGVLKAIYDQNLYNKARMTQGMETITPEVRTSCIFTCETTPTGESLLNRCVIIDFNRIKWPKSENGPYNTWWSDQVMERRGFGFLLAAMQNDIRDTIVADIGALADIIIRDPRLSNANERLVNTYSIVYGAFLAMSKIPAFHDLMVDCFGGDDKRITEDTIVEDIVRAVAASQSVVKSQDVLQTFFQYVHILFMSDKILHFAQKVPAGGPHTHLRFRMGDLFSLVIAEDRRGKNHLENITKSDIEHRIREKFNVRARSDKLYGDNSSCYTLSLATLEREYGISLDTVPTQPGVGSIEDDAREHLPTFDPERIEQGLYE